MEENKTAEKSGVLQKLYGGIEMSWVKVIALALISAVITTVFLVVPIFKDTSFERMGIDFEAWFVLAILIMPNCKKPLDSALKTFVFFLISQPLIYLFEVPFSDMGWKLFGYYRTWFYWTLLTFPMAFIGWYLKKRNWLSTLIIAPVVVFMTVTGMGTLFDFISDPPKMIVTTVLCLAQTAVFIFAFTSDKKQKIILAAIAAVTVAAVIINMNNISYSGDSFLPDGYTYSENAELTVEGDEGISVELSDPGQGIVYVNAKKVGTVSFTIKDGDKEDSFELTIYKEKNSLQF